MKVTSKVIPWPPPSDQWPEGFSVYPRGWCRWYRGQKRHVAGKSARPADLARIWEAKREAIDSGGVYIPSGPLVTLKALAVAYFAALERRRADDTAKPLSGRQFDNLVYEARRFIKFARGSTPLAAVGPQTFAAYRQQLGRQSPQSIASVIGRVNAMFTWAHRNGVISDPMKFGDDWQRPHRSRLRDRRLSISKTYSEDEVRSLFRAADPMWRCWIALGVCAGFTVSDLSNLTSDVVEGDSIDYRRRKVGKVRRIIPVVPGLRSLLDAYARQRPAPGAVEFADRVFLNDAGFPIGHFPRETEASILFRRLQRRAGISKPGRAFGGLRTTHYNATLKFGDMERHVLMGRRPPKMRSIDWESYFEDVDVDPIRHVVSSLFDRYFANA